MEYGVFAFEKIVLICHTSYDLNQIKKREKIKNDNSMVSRTYG